MLHKYQRTLNLNEGARAVGGDGVIQLAISSEAPYERWFGIEILSHDASAVDLTRLADNCHPLLLNHCTDDQIGVLTDPVIGEDRMLRCAAKFSRSTLGQEIQQDVADGIRQLVSVGYFIDEIVEVEPVGEDMADYVTGGSRTWKSVRKFSAEEFDRAMREKHGEVFHRSGPAAARAADDEPPTFLVTRWTPFEASIVPVPADVTVGIGRSAGADPEPAKPAAPDPSPIVIVEHKHMDTPVQKSPAELEAERKLAIIGLAEQYAKYLNPNDGRDACQKGMSKEAFVELIMDRMASKHTDTSALNLDLSQREVQRYSIGNAIRAMTIGDWSGAGFERECSEAISKIMGRGAEGIFIPPAALMRDFNIGTATEAGNLKPTYLRDDLYVDVLRNKLALTGLGVRVLAGLTGDVDMPRKSAASTIGSNTEIGSASETNPTTAKTTLSPKRLTAYVEVSKQSIIQSALALEPLIRDDLLSGVAVQMEYNCINGNGTNQPTGIRNTTGIGTATAGANGGTVTWANVVDLESACANANAEPDVLAGYLTNTKQRGRLKQVQKGTNLPFIWDGGDQPLNGYRAAITNNVPANLTKGTATTVCSAALFSSDWSMGVIGLFGAPDVTVDPYTKADTGQVKITINQFHDFGIRQAACFSKIEDLL